MLPRSRSPRVELAQLWAQRWARLARKLIHSYTRHVLEITAELFEAYLVDPFALEFNPELPNY